MAPELLGRLDRWLAANRPDYYARLLPDATETALAAFEARFSLELPQDFRDLHEWRNGQEATCSASVYENRMFSSLEEIAATKELLDDMIGADFEDPRWWRRGWIPFLASGGGEHLCVDVTAEDGGQPGQLVKFWHDWDDRSVKYTSLERWLEAIVRSMENGTLELS